MTEVSSSRISTTAWGWTKVCKDISSRHALSYDLNDILSKLIYTRILYPSSKLSSHREAARLIEQPTLKPLEKKVIRDYGLDQVIVCTDAGLASKEYIMGIHGDILHYNPTYIARSQKLCYAHNMESSPDRSWIKGFRPVPHSSGLERIKRKVETKEAKRKPLSLFGLGSDLKVVDVRPTNIPIVRARELRMDNLFELEDGSVAILDYESTCKEEARQTAVNMLQSGRFSVEEIKGFIPSLSLDAIEQIAESMGS